MSRFVTALTLSLVLFATIGCQSKPEAAATSKALTKYLKAEYQDPKIEHLQIVGPTNVRVGDYIPELEGWPVYADQEVRYTQETIRYRQTSDPETPVAYVKNVGGEAVCFKPAVLALAEAAMQKDFEKLMQKTSN
ncbi:MAG: hypothetical protein AB8G99_27440 [Planctomycetaceae bacterium]